MLEKTITDIRKMGFEWPRRTLIADHSVSVGNKVDLQATLEKLGSTQAFCRRQPNQAYKFKAQTGADYVDFTDRHDEYAHRYHDAEAAIKYLEAIIAATKDRDV